MEIIIVGYDHRFDGTYLCYDEEAGTFSFEHENGVVTEATRERALQFYNYCLAEGFEPVKPFPAE